MATIKFMCCVYGECSTFPVEISRNARGYALQQAVAATLSSSERVMPPHVMCLFIARKNGVWLTYDNELETLLSGPVDMTYEEIKRTSRLSEYFDEYFKPEGSKVHVLVARRHEAPLTIFRPPVKPTQ